MSTSTRTAAIDVTEKWVGMYTKDKSAQPTAVNDGYREQYALMEKSRCGFWFYGPHASPALMAALGDAIQGMNNPRVGPKRYMLANPEGPMMTTSCKEKEAAWEFMQVHRARATPLLLYTANRAVPPVRKSVSQQPGIPEQPLHQARRSPNPTPGGRRPTSYKNWTNFQDKIPPFWQETLREKISVAQFHQQAAKFLRGQG